MPGSWSPAESRAPDQLAQVEAEELLRRVEHFAATSTGDVLLRAGNRYELSRLMEWIHAARRDRQRSRAASEVSPRTLRPQRGDDRRARTPANGANAKTAAGPRLRACRPPRRASATRAENEASAAARRFYLSCRTRSSKRRRSVLGWERLEALGVRTVADFLQADPDATAVRLKQKSVDADVIRSWQQQAALVCGVPWLRGHDAQILVACGVTDPEALAKLDAATLWKTVQPLAESAEGNASSAPAKRRTWRRSRTGSVGRPSASRSRGLTLFAKVERISIRSGTE